MTQEVRMTIGITGSGKSTWIQQEIEYLENEHKTTCVISRDKVRMNFMLPGDSYFKNEELVFKEFVREINEAMEIGIDVVFIDATHINFLSRNKLLQRLIPDSNTKLIFEVFDVSLNTALKQNNQRFGLAKVSDEVIKKMFKDFTVPKLSQEVPFDKWGFKSVEYNIRKRKEE